MLCTSNVSGVERCEPARFSFLELQRAEGSNNPILDVRLLNGREPLFPSLESTKSLLEDHEICILGTDKNGFIRAVFFEGVISDLVIEKKINVRVIQPESSIGGPLIKSSPSNTGKPIYGYIDPDKYEEEVSSVLQRMTFLIERDKLIEKTPPLRETNTNTVTSSTPVLKSVVSAPASATPAKPKSFFGKLGKLFG